MNELASSVDILLVDDDTSFTKLVKRYLSDEGYTVAVRSSGLQAVEYMAEHTPRLVVLDIMMPEMDGLQACQKIRLRYNGPILMLTALDEEVDEILGLDQGADDYLRKPISPKLLLARVRTQLRRDDFNQSNETHEGEDHAPHKLCFGGLEINTYARRVCSGNSPLDLTDLEFDLITYLVQYHGQIISRDQLYKDTMRIDYDGLDRALDLRVSRLRKKLSDDLAHTVVIKTIRNQGYMLTRQDPI